MLGFVQNEHHSQKSASVFLSKKLEWFYSFLVIKSKARQQKQTEAIKKEEVKEEEAEPTCCCSSAQEDTCSIRSHRTLLIVFLSTLLPLKLIGSAAEEGVGSARRRWRTERVQLLM